MELHELGRIERAIESYSVPQRKSRDGDLSNNLGIALSAVEDMQMLYGLASSSVASTIGCGVHNSAALDATGMVDGAIDAHAMASR